MIHHFWQGLSLWALCTIYFIVGAFWTWLYLPTSLRKSQIRYLKEKEVLLQKHKIDNETPTTEQALSKTLKWFERSVIAAKMDSIVSIYDKNTGVAARYDAISDAFSFDNEHLKLLRPHDVFDLTKKFNLKHVLKMRLLHFAGWPLAIVWLAMFTWSAILIKDLFVKVIRPVLRTLAKTVNWLWQKVFLPSVKQIGIFLKVVLNRFIIVSLKKLTIGFIWAHHNILVPLARHVWTFSTHVYEYLVTLPFTYLFRFCSWFFKRFKTVATYVLKKLWAITKRVLDMTTRLVKTFWSYVVLPLARTTKRILSVLWRNVIVPLSEKVLALIKSSIELLQRVAVHLSELCVWLWQNLVVQAYRLTKLSVEWVYKELAVPAIKILTNIIEWIWRDVLVAVVKRVINVLSWIWKNLLIKTLTEFGKLITWLWKNVAVRILILLRRVFIYVFKEIITRGIYKLHALFVWLWRNAIIPTVEICGRAIRWLTHNIVVKAWSLFIELVKTLWVRVFIPTIRNIFEAFHWLLSNFAVVAKEALRVAEKVLRVLLVKPLRALLRSIEWLWLHGVVALLKHLHSIVTNFYSLLLPILRALKNVIVHASASVRYIVTYAWQRVVRGLIILYDVFAHVYQWIIKWANREAISDLKKLEKEQE